MTSGPNRILPRRRGEVDPWVARASVDPNQPAFIVQTREGDDIGAIGLRIEATRGELELAFHEPRWWQRGYGSEATAALVDGVFLAKPIERLELLVVKNRRPTLSSFAKAGFAREGTVRGYTLPDGRVAECVIMSMLRSEWLQRM